MSGRQSRKNQDRRNKETHQKRDGEECTLAPEANQHTMASLQASLDGISKQLTALREEMKRDLRVFKEEITAQMETKFTEFSEDINHKLTKVDTEIKEQNTKMDCALERTEEVEKWSTEVNRTLQELLEERTIMMEKLDSLENYSRRNNLRIYSLPEDVESESDSMIQFIDGWLRQELDIDTELSIQRAHRALAPKRKPDEPPRSIVLNFQRFDVKEMLLKKAWGKKIVKFGEKRIFFDHDYSDMVLKQRKSYATIKSILKAKDIRFNTPYNKIHIKWDTGKVIYHSAAEAARDMRKRGLEVDGGGDAEDGDDGDGAGVDERRSTATLTGNLQAARLAAWEGVGKRGRTAETRRRARERLQGYRR